MTNGEHLTTEPVASFAAIARALTGSLELPEVLRRIANEARALSDATRVSILLLRDGIAEFVAHASPPPGSLIPVGFQFQPGDELLNALRDRTEPLAIRDLHTSPLIPAVVKDRIFVNDLVIVPLRAEERLIGVLNLAFNQMPDRLPWDPILFSALADQAALAVRNAQLFEATRTSNEERVHTEKLSALGRLVAQVTHELNNPLTTARLLAESLDLEPLPYGAMELARSLSRELEHAATIVGDLLLFVHRGSAPVVEISAPELIQGIVTELDRRLSATGVSITLEFTGPLPNFLADPHALRRVILNLVLNGIQALTGLNAERRIQIRAYAEGSNAEPVLVIEVEDTGAGIPLAVQNRLFEPFFTTKPIGEGTGLGLTIIKEIVETYGGTIEGSNAPSGGALFRVRLPAIAITSPTSPVDEGDDDAAHPAGLGTPGHRVLPARPAHDNGAPHQDTMATAGDPPLEGGQPEEAPHELRVLIIDDEPELQRALRRVLTHLGCDVVTALDGETGIQKAQGQSFDLVLCDVRLPGLHGPELLDRMRLQAPRAAAALVFMTGDTITREIREFIAQSGRPSLTKPFGRTQLQRLLGNVRAERG
jgi:two-component system NtrC family sensor kinase